MTKNQIAWEELQEKIRSNKAQEGETYRANLAREANTAIANEISARNVDLGYANVALGYANVAQRDRQLAYDKQQDLRNYQLKTWEMYYGNERAAETQRSNVAREQETTRHNKAVETAGYMQAGTRIVDTTIGAIGKGSALLKAVAKG